MGKEGPNVAPLSSVGSVERLKFVVGTEYWLFMAVFEDAVPGGSHVQNSPSCQNNEPIQDAVSGTGIGRKRITQSHLIN